MLILYCLYCGVMVDEIELVVGGEVYLKCFGFGLSDDEFEGYLFVCENFKGVYFECWCYVYGCGKWFFVVWLIIMFEVFGIYLV